jgi:predicted small lipoprotein YifL
VKNTFPRKTFIALAVAALALAAAACGSGGPADPGKEVKSAPAGNNLTAVISSADGALRNGDQEFVLAFKDASGKAVEVGAASLNFYMPPMGTMPAMNDPAALTTTSTPGVYRARVRFEAAGDWQGQLTYEGPAGKGKANIPVTVQQGR